MDLRLPRAPKAPLGAAPPPPRRAAAAARSRRLLVSARSPAQQRGAWVAEAPPAPEPPLRPDGAAPLALGLAAAAAAIAWRRLRGGGGRRPPARSRLDIALEAENGPPGGEPSREFKMALARTRQAVAVQKSVGFMRAGNTARAVVELRRALHENSACRSPLLNTAGAAAGDLARLYRLHVENAPVPADFATLLQLRTMLGIGFDEAEEIERRVMDADSAFSI